MMNSEIDFSTPRASKRTFPSRGVVTLSRENEPIERPLAYSRLAGVSYITLNDEVEDFD